MALKILHQFKLSTVENKTKIAFNFNFHLDMLLPIAVLVIKKKL